MTVDETADEYLGVLMLAPVVGLFTGVIALAQSTSTIVKNRRDPGLTGEA
jgi:hypothetical protein